MHTTACMSINTLQLQKMVKNGGSDYSDFVAHLSCHVLLPSIPSKFDHLESLTCCSPQVALDSEQLERFSHQSHRSKRLKPPECTIS